jgi:hypothetical protein
MDTLVPVIAIPKGAKARKRMQPFSIRPLQPQGQLEGHVIETVLDLFFDRGVVQFP